MNKTVSPTAQPWLVVLVDDDESYLRDYKKGIETFSKSHKSHPLEIKSFSSSLEAIEFCRCTTPRKSLWILDSMMPFAGEFDERETKSGLETGIMLLKQLRTLWSSGKDVHFLIVTNYSKTAIEDALGDIPTKGIHSKLHCSPKQLAGVIDAIIS